MYRTIEFSAQEGVARITLNRPDKLNSFNREMHAELADALTQVESSEDLRVLVLGANGRGFCAGQDLSDDAVSPGKELGELVGACYNPLILRITQLALPVIARIQGVAAGAGANLALAADIVIAGESAKFIQAFSGIGLVPDSGGTWHLPRLVGQARAMGLALTGEPVKAEDAVEMGMIWRAVPDEELGSVVEDLASKFAQAPTLGLARIKNAIRESTTNTLEAQLALEANIQNELGHSADYAEGVAAFYEKRTPEFVGR